MNYLNVNENLLKEFCQKNDISYLGLFGSYSRGEQKEDSDIDLLVRFKKPISLMDLVGAEQELEELLGKEVDLITERSLSPYIKDNVLKDIVPLYE